MQNIDPWITGPMLLARLGLWAYWQWRKKSLTREQSPGPFVKKPWSMWLPTLIFVGQLIQLVGIGRLPLPVPAALQSVTLLAGQLCFWFAIGWLVWSRESLGNSWAHAVNYQEGSAKKLVRHGPYHFIRHPMYLGFWLLYVGIELTFHSWFLTAALPLVFVFNQQARREEVLLAQRHGSHYRHYEQQTWRFIPWLY